MFVRILSSIIVFSLLIPLPVAALNDDQAVTMEHMYADKVTNVQETQKRVIELSSRLSTLEQKAQAAKEELGTVVTKQQELSERLVFLQELSSSLASQRASVAAQREVLEHASTTIALDLLPMTKGNVPGGMSSSLQPKVVAGLKFALLTKEAEQVDLRLSAMASVMDEEMSKIQKSSKYLAQRKEVVTTIVDTSWKSKNLTEQELKEVRAEDNAVMAELQNMRSHLLDISSKLKREKVKELTETVRDHELEIENLKIQREELTARRQGLEAIRDAFLSAENALVQQKNVDQKQFKRIEDVKEELQLLTREYDKLTHPSQYEIDALASMSDEDKLKREERMRELHVRIPHLQEKLKFLEDGVPHDTVEHYFEQRTANAAATLEDEKLLTDLAEVDAAIADAGRELIGLSDELEQARHVQLVLEEVLPQFIWPVAGPITAGFHDEEYRHVFGVAHQAIDIATSQGTGVKAIADGIVYKVKNGGARGYSYILIVHRDGYASLYGHMNTMSVQVGDSIHQGQIIGRSGGEPGTPGSGPMTTGSHLHLEIIKNGGHIDPRSVLPKR